MRRNQTYQKIVVRTLVAAVCASFASGCAVDPVTGKPSIKETFASDDPCSQNARNIGIGVGILAGALIGKQVNGSNKGLLLGAALGGAIGGLIGNDIDKRRCALAKIAKQYNLDLQVTSLDRNGQDIAVASVAASGTAADAKKPEAAGSLVEIRDPVGAGGHFESNSDKLTARAQQYFAAIADTYNPQKNAAEILDAKEKAQYLAQANQRKILLIGHTDDTGASSLNADLSERRARAVTKFMEEHGVPKSSLYFQGAGEFYPIADNNSEDGRAKNRRVDIVEMTDKTAFDNYLASRKPRIEFYRAQSSDAVTAAESTTTPAAKPATSNAGANKKTARVASNNDNNSNRSNTASIGTPAANVTAPTRRASTNNGTTRADIIDFGGVPLTPTSNLASIGQVAPKKSFFSLISSAYADTPIVLDDCTRDRPRVANSVKALSDGKTYKTSEHIPGLYGKTWTDQVNGHQIVVNKVAVLAGDGALASLPEFKVYKNYNPDKKNGITPDVTLKPEVNTYLGSKGLLYRMFVNGQGGVQCVDIVFESNGGAVARAGKLIYWHGATPYVADFKPKMYQ